MCWSNKFNPKAILDHDPCEAKWSDLQTSGPSTSIGDSSYPSDEFTAEEEPHFTRRYEEGLDLPNPRYLAWLKVSHPTEPCQESRHLILHLLISLTQILNVIVLAFIKLTLCCHSWYDPSSRSYLFYWSSTVSLTITKVSHSSTSILTVDHSINSPLSTAVQQLTVIRLYSEYCINISK